MTYEEYVATLKDAIDPNKQAEAIIKVADELSKDLTELQAYRVKTTQYEADIQRLRDTNAQLAVRITQPTNNVYDEVNDTPILDEFLNTLKEALNGK